MPVRRSPAKINLFLYVTGRRADGYHELFSLMAPLTLADRLEVVRSGNGIRAVCSHPDVPEDDTNLACRAAALFRSAMIDKKGDPAFDHLTIHIEKKFLYAVDSAGAVPMPPVCCWP